MVHLVKHAPAKLVGWVRLLFGLSYTDDLENGTCGLSSLVLGAWVGETKRFSDGAATDSLSIQHSLLQKPLHSRRKLVEMGAAHHSRNIPKKVQKASRNGIEQSSKMYTLSQCMYLDCRSKRLTPNIASRRKQIPMIVANGTM